MFPVLRIREVVTHICQKRLCKLKWQSSVMTLIGYHWHYMPGKTLKSRDCLGPWFLSVNKININCKLRMFWAYCPSLEMIAVRDWIVFLSNFIMVLRLTRFPAQSQKCSHKAIRHHTYPDSLTRETSDLRILIYQLIICICLSPLNYVALK